MSFVGEEGAGVWDGGSCGGARVLGGFGIRLGILAGIRLGILAGIRLGILDGIRQRQMSFRNELGCECMFKFCKTSAIRMPRRLPDTTIILNCRSTSTWPSSNRIRFVGRRLKSPRISSA
jgi:hypothetical protein